MEKKFCYKRVLFLKVVIFFFQNYYLLYIFYPNETNLINLKRKGEINRDKTLIYLLNFCIEIFGKYFIKNPIILGVFNINVEVGKHNGLNEKPIWTKRRRTKNVRNICN